MVTTHQRGKQTLRRGGPTAHHPNIAVWTRASGTKGQEKPPKAPAWLPRVKGCPHQLPISEIWGPHPRPGEQGQFKLGTAENLFLWLAGSSPGPGAQRYWGAGSPGGQVTESCARSPLTWPGRKPAEAAGRGCCLGRKLGGHVLGRPGVPLEPQGRCWWWWAGRGQTRDTRHTWTKVTYKTSP